MKNPWLDYKFNSKSKVHSKDVELFHIVNKRLAGKTGKSDKVLSAENVALPYFGNPKGNLVLLYANPGLDKKNTKVEETPKLQKIFDKARKHQKIGKHNFVFLLEEFRNTPGYNWWERVLESIIEESGLPREKVLNNIFSAEIHPYKSVKYGPLNSNENAFPSSTYTYSLVAQSLKRKSLILIARAEKEWLTAVPELKNYKNIVYLSSTQQAKITSNNVILDRKASDKAKSKQAAWQMVLKAVRRAPGSRA